MKLGIHLWHFAMFPQTEPSTQEISSSRSSVNMDVKITPPDCIEDVIDSSSHPNLDSVDGLARVRPIATADLSDQDKKVIRRLR
jgi:hypothetical protein